MNRTSSESGEDAALSETVFITTFSAFIVKEIKQRNITLTTGAFRNDPERFLKVFFSGEINEMSDDRRPYINKFTIDLKFDMAKAGMSEKVEHVIPMI